MSETPSNTGFGAFNTASKTKDLLVRLIRNIIDEERPAPKHAFVQSVDWAQKKAMVVYQGDGDAVPVALTGFYPRIGQQVIVDGLPGDRHITETIGHPLGIGDDIYNFTGGVITGSGFDQVSFHFYIPQVWAAYDVKFLWLPGLTSSSGNVDLKITDNGPMTVGSHAGSGTPTNVVVPVVASMEYDYQETVMLTNQSGFGTRSFNMSRDGFSGNDTWPDDVVSVGLILTEST